MPSHLQTGHFFREEDRNPIASRRFSNIILQTENISSARSNLFRRKNLSEVVTDELKHRKYEMLSGCDFLRSDLNVFQSIDIIGQVFRQRLKHIFSDFRSNGIARINDVF